jgi:hypothetical protein
MTEEELNREEAKIPELAVKALQEAQQTALASGHPVVVVIDGELVRISKEGREVIKKIPSPFKPPVRTKQASK